MTMDIAASLAGSRKWSSAAVKTSIRAKSEEYLYGHPDIQDSSLWSARHEIRRELCAWIVSKAGAALDEEGVRRFCQDRISHYKIRATSASSRVFRHRNRQGSEFSQCVRRWSRICSRRART